MAYAAASDVANLCPHLLSGSTASAFTTSTSPTLAAVNAWLSSGCAIINTKLASKGYDAIPFSSGVWEFAQSVNANYGAWRAERSLVSARVSKMENTRADMFKKDWMDELEMLCGMDLSTMGVGRSKAPPANYGGGISKADKLANDQDPDIIVPRFQRGEFRNPETKLPEPGVLDKLARKDNG